MTKTSRATFLWFRSGNPKSKIENLKLLGIFALVFTCTFGAVAAEAQQSKKVPRIGFLVPGSRAGFAVRVEAFRQGLRELGYVEGKNIAIEYRWAEGKLDRLAETAAELVQMKTAKQIGLTIPPNVLARADRVIK